MRLKAADHVVAILALIWAVHLLNMLFGGALNQFGIIPRNISGLPGILFAPLLHKGWLHIISNSLPLFFLGWLVLQQGVARFYLVSSIIVVVGGAAVWLLARSAIHVGASGLVFGYFGCLLGFAYYQPNVKNILIAFVTLFFYGGMIWGVLPLQAMISWESHLFGLLAGVLASAISHPPMQRRGR